MRRERPLCRSEKFSQPNGESQPVGANCVRPRTAYPGCPYDVQSNVQPVGAIHESPEHGRISHSPNGGAQHVGAGLRARPSKRKIHTNPAERH